MLIAHVKTHQSLGLSAFLSLLFNGNALEVFVRRRLALVL